MSELSLLQRRIERERSARLSAEAILEQKSLELHESKLAAERSAQELEWQNIRVQAIVDGAAEGIITLDFDFEILTFNPAASKIFGLNSTQAIGSKFIDLFKNFDETDLVRFLTSDEYKIDATEYNASVDGRDIIVEVTMGITRGDDSSSMIAIVRDRTKRKSLEAQLAIAQKMESIGQLSAGIAHEINSPMQYVSDNTHFLKDAFDGIQSLLNKYNQLTSALSDNGSCQTLLDAIRQEYEDSDLGFILSEVPLAISQTIEGAERVTTIVQAMKVFSHPGETNASLYCLNESVDSTVTVAKNEWKYLADVELDLDPDLPNCVGYPSKINQALLNMVVNAAHAISKRNESDPDHWGKIKLTTRHDRDSVQLTIEDNGCGIAEENLHHIFDPFFTTKPVGKGTGQGLSITHSIIVETHKGEIDIKSTVGEGTKFTLKIPLGDESSVAQNNALEEANHV